MNRKTSFIVLIIVTVCSFCFGVAACKKDDAPEVKDSIALNNDSLQLEVYDTYTLAAEISGTADKIIWSSSEPSVASVDSGTVTALKEGETTITASFGNAEDYCRIKVTDNGTAPVLTVNANRVNVEKGGEFILSAEVLWKGMPITEPVEYFLSAGDGEREDVISAIYDAARKGFVISGENYGEAVYYLSANVRGALLAEKIFFRTVDPYLVIEIANFTKIGDTYHTDLYTIDYGNDEKSIVPQIIVKDRDGEIVGAKPEWSLDGDTIVCENGTITAIKEGESVIHLAYVSEEGATANISAVVNVMRPRIPVNFEEKIVIERVGEESCVIEFDIENLQGEIIGAYFSSDNVLKNHEQSTASSLVSLTLDRERLPSSATEMGEQILSVETEKAVYEVPVTLYTMIIRTAEDLDKMGEVAKASADEPNLWDGYFILGNDIDYGGKQYVSFIGKGILISENGTSFKGNNWDDGNYNGFRGIFDGCGYTIDRIKCGGEAISPAGFIGILHTDGIIKNVSFTNAYHNGWSGFLVSAGNGTVENVYISATTHLSGVANSGDNSSFIFSYSAGKNAKVKNCFIETAPSPSAKGYYGIGSATEGYGMLENVYCVGTTNGIRVLEMNGGGVKNVYGAFGNYTDLISANIDFSSWEGDFWRISNGLPYPKNLKISPPSVTVEQFIGRNYFIVNNIKQSEKIELDSSAVEMGVRNEGNLIYTEGLSTGTVVRFTVKNIFDSEVKQNVSVVLENWKLYKNADADNFQYPTDRENYVVTETQYKTNIVFENTEKSLYFEADKWGARLKTNGWDLRGIRKVQFAVYNYWQDYDLLHYFCESTSGVYLPIKKDTWNTVTFDVDAYKYAYPDSDLSNICSTLQFDAVEGTPIYISSIYLFRYDTFTSYGGGTYESISPEIFSYPVEEHYTANVHEISAAQKYDGDNTLLIKSGEANCWGIRFTTNAWDLSGINKLQFAVRNTWGAELLIKHEFCEAETTTITTNAATWTVITLDIAAYRAKHPDADMSNVNSAIEITGYTYTNTPIYFSDFYVTEDEI